MFLVFFIYLHISTADQVVSCSMSIVHLSTTDGFNIILDSSAVLFKHIIRIHFKPFL